MKAVVTRAEVVAAILAISTLMVPLSSVRCEVGADWNPSEAGMATLHRIAAIGDGPDPWSGIWLTLGSPSSGRVILNPLGDANGDGPPSVITDPTTGVLLVAWAKNSPNGFDVVLSQFANGTWTTPQVVAGDVLVSEKDPTMVLAADGSVHLFYWIDGTEPAVYYKHGSPDLTSWSAPVLVSQAGEPACRPAAASHNGVLHVAYEVHDFGLNNAPSEVVLSRQDGSGFTPEIVAMTNNSGSISPQVHSQSGHIWVDWVDTESDGAGEVGWTRIDSQGHWEPIQYESFPDPLTREYLVRGAVKLKAIR